MQLPSLQHAWQYVTVLGVAVVLLLSVIFGYRAGNTAAQASFAVTQSAEITKALNYFYNDFDRYPTAEEFFDQKIMATYFSSFPLVQITSSACTQTFAYRLLESDSYQLGICLPVAVPGWQIGWNRISEKK